MNALASIQRDIDRTLGLADGEAGIPFPPAAKRYARAKFMQVQVGVSAERSILAVTGDETLPETIDDVPVVRTSEFEGYAVVLL